MRKLMLALGAVIMLSIPVKADEILLRSGNVIRGEILEETETTIKIKVFFGDDTDSNSDSYVIQEMDKKRIRKITRGGSLLKPRQTTVVTQPGEEKKTETVAETPTVEENKDTEAGKAEGEAGETPAPEAGNKDKKKEEKEIDPALKKQIEMLIGNLSSIDESVRESSEQRLQAIGKDAISLVAACAKSSSSHMATLSSIKVLRALRAKEATRLLIDKLQGTNADRSVMRAAHNALKDITGQAIYFNEQFSIAKRNTDRGKWLEWFKTVEEEYPEQIGYEKKEEPDKKDGKKPEKKEEAGKKPESK
ncbi:MAG: hypothetical protein JXR97_16260 [Planctomycetes bacterium]|nr:hypothetical protein [Planctomycetota bacterium]